MSKRIQFGDGKFGLWKRKPRSIDDRAEFVAECLRLWDRGFDTNDIARILFQYESVVETAVRIGRERRRKEDLDNAENQEEDG